MYPHRIRLRGPWECEPLARRGDRAGEPLPSPLRMNMPCRWGEAGLMDFAGRVRFRRRFGYPGRIDEHERVWLTFDGIDGEAEISLNDHPLGRLQDLSRTFEFEVTSLLRSRNELVVDVEGTAEQGGLWGEVALEVRCAAWLRNVRRSLRLQGDEAELRVSGQVVGVAERPLELYIVLDRSVVAYQEIAAIPEGQCFEILARGSAEQWSGGAASLGRSVVKVDLVNGARVWYTNEAEITFEPPSDTSE
jgi:hypothetical protein